MRSFGKTNERTMTTKTAVAAAAAAAAAAVMSHTALNESEKKIKHFYLSSSLLPSLVCVYVWVCSCSCWFVFAETRSQRSSRFIVFVIEASLWLPYAADRWSLFVSVDSILFLFFFSLRWTIVHDIRSFKLWFLPFDIWFVFAVNAIAPCRRHCCGIPSTYVRIINERFDNIYFNGILELHQIDFCQCKTGASSNHFSTET